MTPARTAPRTSTAPARPPSRRRRRAVPALLATAALALVPLPAFARPPTVGAPAAAEARSVAAPVAAAGADLLTDERTGDSGTTSVAQRVPARATRTWTRVPTRVSLGGSRGVLQRAGKARTRKLAAHPEIPDRTRKLVVRVEVLGAKKPGKIALRRAGAPRSEATFVRYRKGTTRAVVRVTTSFTGRLRVASSSTVRLRVRTVGHVPRKGTPNAQRTGVPEGTRLRIHEGDLVVRTDGAVVDRVDVRGFLRIEADDVTVRRTVVRGRPTTRDAHLVQVADDARRATIVDTEITAANPSPYIKGIVGSDLHLLRVDVHGVIDQLSVTGDDVLVEDSWFHDNLSYASDPQHGGGPSHDDNVQVSVGRNIRIIGSRLSGASSAALMVTQDRGRIADLRLERNRIDGGACSVNVAEKSQGPVEDVVLTDNRFGTGTRLPYCAVISPRTTQIEQVRNAFVDGTTVSVRRG